MYITWLGGVCTSGGKAQRSITPHLLAPALLTRDRVGDWNSFQEHFSEVWHGKAVRKKAFCRCSCGSKWQSYVSETGDC